MMSRVIRSLYSQIENNLVNKETSVHGEEGDRQGNLLWGEVIHRDG